MCQNNKIGKYIQIQIDKTNSNNFESGIFFTPIIFKNPLKTGFSLRNILFTICVRCVWSLDCNIYFLFKKKITFVNSQHKNTNLKGHFVLKNWF